jgi:hypothetical protein
MYRARRARRWSRVVGVVSVLVLVAGTLVTGGPARPVGAATVPPSPSSPGYWLVASDGGIYAFGTANLGSMRGIRLARPVTGGAATTDGLGYWMTASDGGVFSFGDARFFGSTGGVRLNQPIVGMAATASGKGYWLVARDGGVFSFGDARFFGSTGGIRLNQPIVGMAATASGDGYWLVASDGGVFSFGDARFFGSTGGIRLNQPVVGMAPGPLGKGYWLVARDGGVFSFGDAVFHGSTGNVRLAQPVVGAAASADGAGYWFVARDGGIFNFGDAHFLGSTGSAPGPFPIVTMAATPHGFPFPPGGKGFDISLFQCPGTPGGPIPPTHQAVSIVQVSGGAINNPPNPCYVQEAQWAGANISAYIFMDGLPSPAPVESRTGPAGTCNGNVSCESYNFGWSWARHWVAYSRSVAVNPTMWWLDVEAAAGAWNLGPAFTASNARVISGALAGLQSSGVLAGVYTTEHQWGEIAGAMTLPSILLWVPGAGNLSGPGFTATNYCATGIEAVTGGRVVLVQYGYGGTFLGAFPGPRPKYDMDFACP